MKVRYSVSGNCCPPLCVIGQKDITVPQGSSSHCIPNTNSNSDVVSGAVILKSTGPDGNPQLNFPDANSYQLSIGNFEGNITFHDIDFSGRRRYKISVTVDGTTYYLVQNDDITMWCSSEDCLEELLLFYNDKALGFLNLFSICIGLDFIDFGSLSALNIVDNDITFPALSSFISDPLCFTIDGALEAFDISLEYYIGKGVVSDECTSENCGSLYGCSRWCIHCDDGSPACEWKLTVNSLHLGARFGVPSYRCWDTIRGFITYDVLNCQSDILNDEINMNPGFNFEPTSVIDWRGNNGKNILVGDCFLQASLSIFCPGSITDISTLYKLSILATTKVTPRAGTNILAPEIISLSSSFLIQGTLTGNNCLGPFSITFDRPSQLDNTIIESYRFCSDIPFPGPRGFLHPWTVFPKNVTLERVC